MDDSEEKPELTPEQRAATRAAIASMPLVDYCKRMCGIELTAAHEAMLVSWCRLQMETMNHNVEVAFASGYTRGRQAGRRSPITLN